MNTSNDDTLTAEDRAPGYTQLMRVEECWRNLTSCLRLRRVSDWGSWRVHPHVTPTVPASLLDRSAEISGGDAWRNLRAEVDAIRVVEYEPPGARAWQTTELKPATATLLKRLQVPNPQKLHRREPLEDAGLRAQSQSSGFPHSGPFNPQEFHGNVCLGRFAVLQSRV